MTNKITTDIPFKWANNPDVLVLGDVPDFCVEYTKGNTPVVFGVFIRNNRYCAGCMRSKTLQGLVNFHYKTCSIPTDNEQPKRTSRPK
jgi:hypothetical protein